MTDEETSDTIDIDRHVGARLAELRHRHGLDGPRMAEAIGVAPAALAAFEAGLDRIPADRLLRAAAVFGVHVNWFFERGPAVPLSPAGEAAAHALACFLTRPGALALVHAYAAIRNDEGCGRVLALARELAEGPKHRSH